MSSQKRLHIIKPVAKHMTRVGIPKKSSTFLCARKENRLFSLVDFLSNAREAELSGLWCAPHTPSSAVRRVHVTTIYVFWVQRGETYNFFNAVFAHLRLANRETMHFHCQLHVRYAIHVAWPLFATLKLSDVPANASPDEQQHRFHYVVNCSAEKNL